MASAAKRCPAPPPAGRAGRRPRAARGRAWEGARLRAGRRARSTTPSPPAAAPAASAGAPGPGCTAASRIWDCRQNAHCPQALHSSGPGGLAGAASPASQRPPIARAKRVSQSSCRRPVVRYTARYAPIAMAFRRTSGYSPSIAAGSATRPCQQEPPSHADPFQRHAPERGAVPCFSFAKDSAIAPPVAAQALVRDAAASARFAATPVRRSISM